MRGTCLIYSSHNRCRHIHDDLIIERALQGTENKRILLLPMSQTVNGGDEYDRQRYETGTFDWYFNRFAQHGLELVPFYWSSGLGPDDVDRFWHLLYSSQVVLLAGGSSELGLRRYKALGARFGSEPGRFGRILHERQARGLLTVGFSAGADQLGEVLSSAAHYPMDDSDAFSLARNVVTTLHHERGREGDLMHVARSFPHCMAFGLPNDSGLNVDQGVLPSGSFWQVIEFVVDRTWDIESEQWHIKTRQGVPIEHFGSRGEHWAFHGGEKMVRVQSADHRYRATFVTTPGGLIDFDQHQPAPFGSIEEVLASH